MREQVQEYYGKILNSSDDLKTDACCTSDSDIPSYLKQGMEKIHPEVSSKYYGCGLVRPQLLKDTRILDLGSGSGRDCFLLSYLTGEQGAVIGVDMTDEQLAVANKYIDYHRDAYGYQKANVEFRKGYIEQLDELDLADNSFDIIVSNCVINLSPDKESVLKQAFRLLKPGGELYFSDVYSDRRVPSELINDPILYGECLSGALYWNDFLQLAQKCGFTDPRLVEDRPLAIDNAEVEKLIGHIGFYSATYRLFKLDDLELSNENYDQSVCYNGTIEHYPNEFVLDKYQVFETGKKVSVSGNTFKMLNETRFKEHFEFYGDRQTHYGAFSLCGIPNSSELPFDEKSEAEQSGGSCCC